MNMTKYKLLLSEFLRYVIVGGISFIVDLTTLSLCKEILLKDIIYSLYVSTAIGFLAGVISNYILCLKFVFSGAASANLGKSIKDKILFVLIGIIGLFINELGMWIGVQVLAFNYVFVKVITAAVVMLWNYIARKKLIFSTDCQNRIKKAAALVKELQ